MVAAVRNATPPEAAKRGTAAPPGTSRAAHRRAAERMACPGLGTEDLARLSRTAGVDLEALRRKYLRPAAAGAARDGQPAASPLATPAQVAASERLAALRALPCRICKGSGLERAPYNHMLLERNCEACDGEGVLLAEAAAGGARAPA